MCVWVGCVCVYASVFVAVVWVTITITVTCADRSVLMVFGFLFGFFAGFFSRHVSDFQYPLMRYFNLSMLLQKLMCF